MCHHFTQLGHGFFLDLSDAFLGKPDDVAHIFQCRRGGRQRIVQRETKFDHAAFAIGQAGTILVKDRTQSLRVFVQILGRVSRFVDFLKVLEVTFKVI